MTNQQLKALVLVIANQAAADAYYNYALLTSGRSYKYHVLPDIRDLGWELYDDVYWPAYRQTWDAIAPRFAPLSGEIVG